MPERVFMTNQADRKGPDKMIRQFYHFLVHLRLHYQFFILSGGFLLGGLMAGQMDAGQFWLQFLNVHLLLFGGATAFNSWWDKDEGPVGGLKHPPGMSAWMRPASVVLMFGGWGISIQQGVFYFAIYGVSLILFWLYSTPVARWKGNPILSLVAIGVSTGFNSVLLGTIAAGGIITWNVSISAAGASFILLSLYPVSQVYQMEEDRARGDQTFAIEYGLTGVKRFFTPAFFGGLILLCSGLYMQHPLPALIFFISGSISGVILLRLLYKLRGVSHEYGKVMQMKFFASLSFVLLLLIINSIRYEWVNWTI